MMQHAAHKSRPSKRFSRFAGLSVSSLSPNSQSAGEDLLILKLLETVTLAAHITLHKLVQVSCKKLVQLSPDQPRPRFWLPEAILSWLSRIFKACPEGFGS